MKALSPSPSEDIRWMALALQYAAQHRPSPNPPVGAVVVRHGEAVGQGCHVQAGQEHAEVVALQQAGSMAKGATLYVTLEPCNHTGATLPCTEAILAAGVNRVVIGCRDPNPRVTGGGILRLQASGIEVTVGVCEAEASAQLAPWIKYITRGIPYVSLKLAISLDGRIATRTGKSQWITGEQARRRGHALRANHDAILVGRKTACMDNPRLTVRTVPGRSPIRVVLDTHLQLPIESALVSSAHEVPTWIVCGEGVACEQVERLTTRGVTVLQTSLDTQGSLELEAVLHLLGVRGIVNLLVEGGAHLGGSLLAGQCVDALHLWIAPMLLGAQGVPCTVGWDGPSELSEAPWLVEPCWEPCGQDMYVRGRVIYSALSA